MGIWRDLALYSALNPDKVSQNVKDALHARWMYEITHPKKKSGLGGAIKSFVKAPFDAIRGIGRGDIGGIIDASVRSASAGTIGINKGGIMNIAKTPSTSSSAHRIKAATTVTSVSQKKKGLLSHLRSGKGGEGGGSFTSTAKDPIGGESGKTGK